MTSLAQRGEGAAPTGTRIRWLAVVVLLAVCFLGPRLADLPVLDPDEAKHAQVAKEMVAADRWIEPVVYGQPYHHKPSLLYALIRLCYRAVGVNELGARLVPALAGLFTLAALFWEASRSRVATGWLATLLLMASPLFFAVARFTNFDGLLTFVTFTAVISVTRWIESEGRNSRALIAAAALAALAVLVKGPVGAVLVVVPAFFVGLPALRQTTRRAGVGAGAVFIVIIAAWLVPALILHPDYVSDFFWVHNVQRYSVDADVFHPEPVWFFIPVVILTTLPWSPLIPSSLAAAWRRGGASRFQAAYVLWTFAFFSLSNGKLATYVLPAFPILAHMVSAWLDDDDATAGRATLALERVAAALYLVLPVLAYVVLRLEEPGFEHLSFALVPLGVAGGWVMFARNRKEISARATVISLSVATLASYAVALGLFAPMAGQLSSDRDLVETLQARGEAPDVVAVYRVRPYSFLFYSDGPVLYKVPDDEYRAALIGPGRVWVLSKDSRMEGFVAAYPSIRLKEIARNHRHVVFERVGVAENR